MTLSEHAKQFRITVRFMRLLAARKREQFNEWAEKHHADDWIICASLGAILGAMLAYGF